MNDLSHRLRESAKATFYDPLKSELNEAASHIEKLEEEIGVLIAASIRLSSRIDLDSDGYVDRIEKLEAALTHIYAWYPISIADPHHTIEEIRKFARKALEGKDE
jgi:hypothetical protein